MFDERVTANVDVVWLGRVVNFLMAVIMPLEKTYWAEAFGMVTDPFGVKWMINCDQPK